MRNCRIPSSWLIKCVCVCVCVSVFGPFGGSLSTWKSTTPYRKTKLPHIPQKHYANGLLWGSSEKSTVSYRKTHPLMGSFEVSLRFLLDTYHIQRNSIYQWSFLGILYLEMYINLPQSDIDIARHTHIPMSSTGALGGMLDGAFRALYWTCA